MLKIWLPLKKDRRNIGLSEECREFKKTNMVIRTTGSPIDDKSCGYGYGLYHMEADDFDNDFTVATWIKKEGSWSKTNTIVSCKNISASNVYQWYMSIFSSDTQTGMRFQINNGGEWGSYNFLTNTWYHVAGTYNSTTHEYAIYVNGEAIKTGTSTRAKTTGCTNIGVNCRANDAIASGTPVAENNVIADFRIYSHALKDWEIKDLYNCKAIGINGGLHLKETTNMLAGKSYTVVSLTTNCTSQDDGNGGKVINTTTRGSSYSSDSIRLNFPADTGLIDGKDYSISFDCKTNTGSGNMHEKLDVNDATPITKVTNIQDGKTHVELIIASGVPKYSYNQYRFIDFNKVAQNSQYKIEKVQVEEGKTPTPYTPSHRDERFVDLSGLDSEVTPYNITQSGSSLYFNGVDSAIKIPMHEMISGGTWSINLWFYRPNGEFGTKAWETLVGGPSGFELEATSSSTKTLYVCPYSWGGGKFAYEPDRWNMVTLTRTSSGSKLYINGSLVKSGSAGSMPSGDYFIGAWKTATQQNFKGYMRRFSIYKKELTQEDITNLYQHNE